MQKIRSQVQNLNICPRREHYKNPRAEAKEKIDPSASVQLKKATCKAMHRCPPPASTVRVATTMMYCSRTCFHLCTLVSYRTVQLYYWHQRANLHLQYQHTHPAIWEEPSSQLDFCIVNPLSALVSKLDQLQAKISSQRLEQGQSS